MNLDEAQKKQVAAWIEQGLKLSEIQSKLTSEFGVTMTYMEARFLMDDLKVKPKDPVLTAPVLIGSKPPGGQEQAPPLPGPMDEPASLAEKPPGTPGGLSLTVDQVTRAGSLVSGTVTFSDGNGAVWYLDQMGRLGMTPKTQGYRPSQEDLQAFQLELQSELARMGM